MADLSALDIADATNNVTALANIYKMFAASGNDFGDNGESGTSSATLTANKAWLPTTNSSSPISFNDGNKTLSSTVNGITWSAKVAQPTDAAKQFARDDATDATSKLASATTLEITGIVAAGTGRAAGGFKYRYTNSSGQLGDQSQALPSNIKTIKIVLKKVA